MFLQQFIRLSLVLASLQGASVWAATYWVSSTGSDGNSCASVSSENDPGRYRTVTGGLSCISPSDTLKVKNGIYNYSFPNNPIPSGTSSQKTCIVGESRDGTIFRPDSSKAGIVLSFATGRNNICLRNFTLDGRNQGTTGTVGGIRQGGGGYGLHNNWEITDLKIINFGRNLTSSTAAAGGNGIVLETGGTGHYLARIHFEDNGQWGSGHGNAIYWRANKSIIEHSYFKRCAHDCLHMTYSSGTHGSAPDDNIVRYNYIDEVGDGAGINFYTGHRNLANDNVIRKARYGVRARRTYNKIYKNTIYDAQYCIRLEAGPGHVVEKNILLNCASTPILNQSSGATLSNNLTNGNASALFVNPDAGDFTLKASIDVGATIPNINATPIPSAVLNAPPTPGNLQAVAR
jgi:hypothetical protein